MRDNYIKEIEINTSNICTANCIFCSRPHGVGNLPFMDPKIFFTFTKQLEDIKCDIIQTSGNGETFLNPYYLEYIKILKNNFGHIPRWIYNNFSLMTKERANEIVKNNLFDKIHTRIDSLEKWIFEKSSNLNQENVFENIKYFLNINTNIPFVILYNNIRRYYEKCQRILGKNPIKDYFSNKEIRNVTDEEKRIKEYFQSYSKKPITICNIGHCLWGEREKAPPEHNTPCPKLDIINHVTWVCPNGDVSVCCYDDRQDTFIAGNILKEHLLDIWHGEKRKKIIDNIKNRIYKDYPCINPKCCGFGT